MERRGWGFQAAPNVSFIQTHSFSGVFTGKSTARKMTAGSEGSVPTIRAFFKDFPE
ncbi:Uncharacterized protein DAT39_017982 [Clarias magur]|uniref:Uncharacterized protein n=1 Tax=Clarias magur TaxID=1594786 RepID=A0A8J4WTD3_CLAMG|nr:Uncharacterized protein DAT39_017982 [Clarias magur]